MKRGTFAKISLLLPLLTLPSSAPVASTTYPQIKIEVDPQTGNYVTTVRGKGDWEVGDRWMSWLFDPIPTVAERMRRLTEDEIDVATVALELAHELDPKVNIPVYSRQIDAMVEEVRKTANGTKDPASRIKILNDYFFKTLKISFDLSDLKSKRKENQYLTGILDTGKGTCATIPLLYLVVAQRLGWPIYPAMGPHHLYLKYVDSKFDQQNIEATSGGWYMPDDEYQSYLEAPQAGIDNGTYYRAMTYKQFAGELIAQAGTSWVKDERDARRGLHLMQIGITLRPGSPIIFARMAQVYEFLSTFAPKQFRLRLHVEGLTFARMAEDRGFWTKEPPDDYIIQDYNKRQAYKAKKRLLAGGTL